MLGLKYLAYALTGSVALYSDAIKSIINVVTAIAAFFAIRISLRPADANHPYGHSKAKYFSAVLEGVLILVASLAVLFKAYGAILDPHPLQAPALGLAVSAAATALNGAWGSLLISTGRKRIACAGCGRQASDDRRLYVRWGYRRGVAGRTDRLAILDPILAALVALNILWSGWGLIRESMGGLMDTALPAEDLEAALATIDANMIGALEAHDLRSRHADRMTFIDFISWSTAP